GEEVFISALYRLAYPNKLEYLVSMFGREISQWSRAFNWFLKHVYTTFADLLLDNLQYWVPQFPRFAAAIASKLVAVGANIAIEDFDIFGFIDCTLRPICRLHGGPAAEGQNAP